MACTVPTNISASICRNTTTAPVTVDDTVPQLTAVLLRAATPASPAFHVAIMCRDTESGIESLTLAVHTSDGQGSVFDELPLITSQTNASEARNMTSVVGSVNTTDINGRVTITQARTHPEPLFHLKPSVVGTPSHRRCWLRSRSPRVPSSLCLCVASTAWGWRPKLRA